MVLEVKYPSASAGDTRDSGSVPGLGRSPGGGHDNPLQYSCLENLTDRGAWWATVHRVTKSRTQLKEFNMHSSGSRDHPHCAPRYRRLWGHILCAGSGSHPFQKGNQETGRQPPGMLLVLVFPSSLSTWGCC